MQSIVSIFQRRTSARLRPTAFRASPVEDAPSCSINLADPFPRRGLDNLSEQPEPPLSRRRRPRTRTRALPSSSRRDPGAVLMYHGTLDFNVNDAWSQRMAGRLKTAGNPCELVTFEGLDHYLEDASARTQMLGKSCTFLNQAFGMQSWRSTVSACGTFGRASASGVRTTAGTCPAVRTRPPCLRSCRATTASPDQWRSR